MPSTLDRPMAASSPVSLPAEISDSVGRQRPRILWVPLGVSTGGDEAVELCSAARLDFDPWQEFALRVLLLERVLGGRWSCASFGLVVPRQNGKGSVIEGRELAGVFLVPDELLLTHTAQQFDTSLEAFMRMEVLLEANADLSRHCTRVSRSHGEEGFTFKVDGRTKRLRYRARTGRAGRGTTGDFLVLDEAMYLSTQVMSALRPALSARPNPQVLYAGSAVDQEIHEHGQVFAQIRERGMRGGDPGLGYMEWSAADSIDDVDDPEALIHDRDAWRQANPALNIRVSEQNVEDERRDLTVRSFLVERLDVGDWPAAKVVEEGDITPAMWKACLDSHSKIVGPVAFAFDVSKSRAWAAIAVAGCRADGKSHIEVVDYRRGTGWLPERLRSLKAEHKPKAIRCAGSSPASALLKALETVDVEVETVNATELGEACGGLFDAVRDRTVRHMGHDELDAAVAGAVRRPVGEAWAWSRKAKADASPLIAAAQAHWHMQGAESDIAAPWVAGV